MALTKTRKKGLDQKGELIEEIHKSVDKYSSVFIFSVENMRNSKLKDVREEWKRSRFFFGKTKVMQVALGRTDADEYMEGLHLISKKLIGNVGLLFTNASKDDVVSWFETFGVDDYARAGNKAMETIHLSEGPLEQFPHSIEPHLRQLGLPTTLKKGVVTLLEDHTVCERGDILTPEQCRILKLLDVKMAKFHIVLEAVWSKKKGFEELETVARDDDIMV